MFTRLRNGERVVGARQLTRAIREGQIALVYLAADADLFITRPIRDMCRELNLPIIDVPDMAALGEACGIQVKTAVAGVKRQ